VMAEERTISAGRLRTGTIFRFIAAGLFLSIVPFFVLMGIFALFGLNSVRWNNVPIYGLKALLVSPLMGVFAAALLTAIAGVSMSFGHWLHSKFQRIELRVLVDDEQATT
jgi:hypothetical protein